MKIKNMALALSAVLILSACSEKKEEEVKQKEPVAGPGKIEITQNKEAFNNKVEEKVNTDDRSYYYSYNKEKTQNDKSYTPIDANMRVRSPYEKVEISMLVSRLSKTFIVKCSACHNDYANGIIGPSLLDKDANSIYDSIKSFKTDSKKNVLMSELVKSMDDKQIQDLANEIATFNKKIRELKAK